MSEYMGLIVGCYEAKEGGFQPGGGFDFPRGTQTHLNLVRLAALDDDAAWSRCEGLREGLDGAHGAGQSG